MKLEVIHYEDSNLEQLINTKVFEDIVNRTIETDKLNKTQLLKEKKKTTSLTEERNNLKALCTKLQNAKSEIKKESKVLDEHINSQLTKLKRKLLNK